MGGYWNVWNRFGRVLDRLEGGWEAGRGRHGFSPFRGAGLDLFMVGFRGLGWVFGSFWVGIEPFGTVSGGFWTV